MINPSFARPIRFVLTAIVLIVGFAVPVLAAEPDAATPVTKAAPPLTLAKARLDPIDQSIVYASANAPEGEAKWIEVDLSDQMVVAYENGVPVRAFVISSGLPQWPTVEGTFRIWAKTAAQTMSGGSRVAGDYYSLPNVQWVSYFYEDYGLHGAYWHNNFGQPMSHGCVNMTNDDAEWLFF